MHRSLGFSVSPSSLPFEWWAHRAPFLNLGLCQRAHIIHVCFKDRPSSLTPHRAPEPGCLELWGPPAASSTLCALRPTTSSPHHCPALPAVPRALSPPLTPSSIHPLGLLCACTPCPAPWLHTSLLTQPGFLGSPQCVSHSLSQLCLFTHPTLMGQVLCRTVNDSMGYNS